MASVATDSLAPEHYRRALGHLPTGVTVITADGKGGPIGMAANSVTSVSLGPPLRLVCLARSSSTWPAIRRARRLCVNVLASHHTDVACRFSARGVDRFDGLGWDPRLAGPGLRDAVAWLDCELTDEHEAGDHTIALARVLAVEASPRVRPLVFFRGTYGTFATASETATR